MNEDFIDLRVKLRKETKTELKAREILLDFLETEKFLQGVKIIRKKYNIPNNGYSVTEQDIKNIQSSELGFLPVEIMKRTKEPMRLYGEIHKEIIKLQKGLEITSYYTNQIISYFVFFNEINLGLFKGIVTSPTSLIDIRDVSRDFTEGAYLHPEHNIFSKTPIGLLLHPETTRRDLEDFISNRWQEIELMLSLYKDSESSLRSIKIKKDKARIRDKILLKNPDKSIKEISGELAKVGIFLESGNISNYRKKVLKKTKKA